MSERLKVTDADLEQARNENDKWQLHSEHLTLQLRESEGRLGEATARYRQQSLRVNQFEGRVNEIEEEKRDILTRSLADVRDHDEAVTLRNRKLMAQESRITIQEELVGQLRGDLNYPTYAYDCQYIQLFMKKPASNWGVSIWEIEIFGYGKGADICKNYVPGTNNRKSKDTNDKPIATHSSATFLSSPKFHGEKPGYIFRPGGSGQGYYKVGFDDHYSPDEHEHHHH